MDRDGYVETNPDIRMAIATQKGKPTKAMPTTGLAPDRHADYILCFRQFAGEVFAIGADERGELACTFVFTAGLELDDLRLLDVEEGFVQWDVAEEIALAMLHGDDEIRGIDVR